MCEAPNSPTHPSSDDRSEPGSSESAGPRYTPQELGEIFLDFYKFLTTLHYNKSDLKLPPPDGWPEITSQSCANFKSEYAIEVLRHLPYFDSKCIEFFHYKSRLIDFTAFEPQDFEWHREELHDGLEFWSCQDEEVDPRDVVCLASGRESFGFELWLNAEDGEAIVNSVRADTAAPVPVEAFLGDLKEAYRTLKLIPGPRRTTMDVKHTPEREGEITQEEVNSQKEEWGTDLDIQYVRQIYRQHGWPETFHKEEAYKALEDWMETKKEERGVWEESPPDWDTGRWT